jgi:hypothetical protein
MEATRAADDELQTRQGALKAEQAEGVRGQPQVDATCQAWRSTVLNACRDLSNSNIMICPNITPKVISDCREFAKVPEADEIIAVDQNRAIKSILIVFGCEGIYWRFPFWVLSIL